MVLLKFSNKHLVTINLIAHQFLAICGGALKNITKVKLQK